MAIGQTSGIEKKTKSTAAITVAFTVAKFGADDDTMSLATAVGDKLSGVFQHTTSAAGEEARVMLSGISKLKLGGTVTRGALVTTNASGQGVAAAPAAGVNNSVIGQAMKSGVSGDIVTVLLKQGQIQG